MAKKKKTAADSKIDIPCQFQSATFVKSASIGVKVICKKLSVEKAMDLLANSRLEVKLAEHDSDQGSFKWGEAKRPVVSVGDCHRISSDGIDITFRLSFDRKSINEKDLAALGGAEGRLKAKKIGLAGEQMDAAGVGGDDDDLV